MTNAKTNQNLASRLFGIARAPRRNPDGRSAMSRSARLPLYAAGALLTATVSAQAALIASNAGATVTDTTANLMWVSDMTLFKTQAGLDPTLVSTIIADAGGVIHHSGNAYDTPANSGNHTLTSSDFSTSSGQMDWFGAQGWVTYLNAIAYEGYTNWTAPSTSDQIAALFTQLGQTSSSIVTTHNGNYSLFTDVPANLFWSSSELIGSIYAESFDDRNGGSGLSPEGGKMFELAVRSTASSGPTPTPEPASLALLGFAAAALGWMRHRRT